MKNRVKILEVSAQIIAEICKKAMQNRVPEDTEVIRVHYNPLTNNFDVILQSKKFDKVPEGALIPKIKDSPVISQDVLK